MPKISQQKGPSIAFDSINLNVQKSGCCIVHLVAQKSVYFSSSVTDLNKRKLVESKVTVFETGFNVRRRR